MEALIMTNYGKTQGSVSELPEFERAWFMRLWNIG